MALHVPRPEDAPFLADINAAERQNPNFKFNPMMSKMEDSRLSWDGECGLIDAKMLAGHLADVTSATYYITGPPGLAPHVIRAWIVVSWSGFIGLLIDELC